MHATDDLYTYIRAAHAELFYRKGNNILIEIAMLLQTYKLTMPSLLKQFVLRQRTNFKQTIFRINGFQTNYFRTNLGIPGFAPDPGNVVVG